MLRRVNRRLAVEKAANDGSKNGLSAEEAAKFFLMSGSRHVRGNENDISDLQLKRFINDVEQEMKTFTGGKGQRMDEKEYCTACDRELKGLEAYEHVDADDNSFLPFR